MSCSRALAMRVAVGQAMRARTVSQARCSTAGVGTRLFSSARAAWRQDSELARYSGGKEKQMNTNIAQDMIAEVPPKQVHQRIVACDGGGGALGHPKVFINLDQPGAHSCGYCGLRFELVHDHH